MTVNKQRMNLQISWFVPGSHVTISNARDEPGVPVASPPEVITDDNRFDSGSDGDSNPNDS